MRRWVLALLVVALAATTTASLVGAQEQPEFKLGFKALADQIPVIAGQPLENEHYGPNGDSLQKTSNGLMVWRKADNWTAFTDGYLTYINGPEGLQVRTNDQRFPWEAELPPPPATTPAPTAAPTVVPTAPPAPTAVPQPTATPAPKPVLRSTPANVIQGQGLQSNSVWILGEVRNEGAIPGYNVTVTARLLSTSGSVIGTGNQVFDYVGPGDTVGYRVEIRNAGPYDRTDVSVDGAASGFATYGVLPITWVKNENTINSNTDTGSRYEFTGTVTTSGKPSSANAVYVWFLDDQGRVIWADFTFVTGTLEYGTSYTFLIRTPWSRDNAKVTSISQVRYYAAGQQR